jgi:hypothetical protein
MAGKSVFSEQAEQFTVVVHALLQDEETRAAFAEAPLATLKHYGIEFKDRAVAKRVEAELKEFAGMAEYDICPPWTWTIAPLARTKIVVGPINIATRATSITWVAKPGDMEEVMAIDQLRVNAFVNQVSVEGRIAALEARIVELEATLAKH